MFCEYQNIFLCDSFQQKSDFFRTISFPAKGDDKFCKNSFQKTSFKLLASSGGEDDKALALLAEDWGLKSTHCLARAEDGGEKKKF